MNLKISEKDLASIRTRGARMETRFVRSGERSFTGFAFDPHEAGRRVAVELLLDGHPVAVALADRPCADPAGSAVGDGCHGFHFVIDAPFEPDSIAEVRVANLGIPVGLPIRGNEPGEPDRGSGKVRWRGGLHFSGWIVAEEGDDRLGVLVDDQLVSEGRPSGWTRIGSDPADPRTGLTIDFHVPQRFADGRLHRLAVTTAGGARLPPDGGVPFVASAGGFVYGLDGASGPERLRAEFLDRLVPMSLPMSSYRDWRTRFSYDAPPVPAVEVGVIAVGAGEMADTLESLEGQTLGAWVAASLPPVADVGGFQIEDAKAFLAGDAAKSAFIVFAMAGTRLAPTALQRLAMALAEFDNARAAYGDVEIGDDDGETWPIFFPAFDYERMLEQGYCGHFFAIRRDELEAALRMGASDIYRVFNTLFDDRTDRPGDVVHVPGVLATLPRFDLAAASETLAKASRTHLRARGMFIRAVAKAGPVFPAVRVVREPDPGDVAIVIATRNHGERLRRCIVSIRPAAEKRQATVIVIDNDSADPTALEYLAELEADAVTIVRANGACNAARLANVGVEAARARYVCLLDDHVEAVDEQWLDELLGRVADPGVGAVGPLMLASGELVAHAGVVAGPDFASAPAFADRILGDPGYGDLLLVAHQQSALGASCLLVSRADYHAVGGMDEIRFPNRFHHFDLCLKLRGLGRRIVLTPHARLLDGRLPAGKSERELANLRAKWGVTISADPFYSPMLSLDGAPFSALAWPPRPGDARVLDLPHPSAIPTGF